MEKIKKIQSLPENQRKIILWILTLVIAILLGWFFFKDFHKRVSQIRFDDIFKIENYERK